MTPESSNPDCLVAEGLHKTYGAFTLGALSLKVPAGKAVGVIGSNGAGKTTLLAGLAGQLSFDRGTVSWAGQSVTRRAWKYKQQVSYCRDVPALYGDLTVRQTLSFVARCQPTWRVDRAQQLLDLFRLEPDKRVKELSRGMKAKLSLLLGISHDVRLLLLDEVTAGVDPDTRDEVQRSLRRLARDRGVAVVMSSHIFEDLEQVSDDVLILRNGAPAFVGSMERIKDMSVVVLAPGVARTVEAERGVVGAWDVPDGRALLVSPQPNEHVQQAAHRSHAALRPASLRDLYFAFRDQS